ncbi:MAG: PKD domain-containing protein [Candidatus Bathyarchaeia archaeon]
MRLLIPAMIMVVALSLCLSGYVAPVHAAEPSLIDIFNQLGFTNVTQTAIETFPAGTYNITLYAKFATYVALNELSYYQVNTTTFIVIFAPSEGGYGYLTPPITKTFEADYQFGLSLFTWLQTRYYSETPLNPNGELHHEVYRNLNDPSMLLIGYDERSICNQSGDQDFNDMVFSLQLEHYLQVTSPYDTPGGEGWYYNGTNAFASLADGVVDYGNGTRRVFTQWSGDATGTDYSKSNTIYMDQNKTAMAGWKTQNYLTVKTDPTGIATIPGQGWYDQGQGTPLTAPSVSGYFFAYWDVDGVSQGNGVNPITVTMNGPHTATAHYRQPYTLTIQTTPGGSTSPPPGGYNYSPGSSVQVTAVPSTNYVLDYWSLDGANVGSANPYTVLMDKNHTLEAVFKSSPPIVVSISPMSSRVLLGQAVVFTSTVSGGIAPYSYQWYLDGSSVPGATSSGWTFTAATIGIHYVKLVVTDSKGSTGESGSARVEVTAVPVGGYSVSVKGQATAKPLATYLSLLGASTIILTAVKRKRRN